MFSTLRTVTCSVVVLVKVMTQAYVMMIAATAMTINRSVARIGDIPFLDFILNKAVSPLANHFQKLRYLTCMNLGYVLDVNALIQDPEKTTVHDVMTRSLVSGKPDMEIIEATRFMFKCRIKRLPVVDRCRLIGLAALTDVVYSNET